MSDSPWNAEKIEDGKDFKKRSEALAGKIMAAVLDHYEDQGHILRSSEIFSALAAVTGFYFATSMSTDRSLTPVKLTLGFALEASEFAEGFLDPDHPNHPAKVFGKILRPDEPVPPWPPKAA
jgi:hypothetical protein